MTRPLPPDHADRTAAVAERARNVVVDAGAGTGKTTLLVARLVRMIAPPDDGPALALPRVAAITFTRKAAGELKLRIREALLSALCEPGLTPVRRGRLSAALGALDGAHVGTIHSFADRLLRLRPVEARLSPSYEIVEDPDALVAETFEVILQAVETGTLADELAGRVDPAIAREAEAAIVDALAAGVRAETEEHEFGARAGLDALFADLVSTRDVDPAAPLARPPDLLRFRELVDELAALVRGLRGGGAGGRYLGHVARRLGALRDETRPAAILAELLRLAKAEPPKMRKGQEFGGDAAAWRAWKAFDGDGGKNPVRGTALRDDLLLPFSRWMARRLVRAAPAVRAAYARVKERHRAVDQVDLLLQLRDLLRDRPDVRADYQALFDHVLVDEFQDTDPLQAEIVLFLCEDGARAARWEDVTLAPGRLTLVGDPKQSIYRFRRADVGVYAAVRDLVLRGPHLVARLSANFRSEPGLIAFLNARFDEVLGREEPGKPAFDPDAGTVVNERLVAGREGPEEARVVLLPLVADPPRKGVYRATEARALASWLRRLEAGGVLVRDPASGVRRAARYGDVAVLVPSTSDVPLLFAELDRRSIPYAARGGSLFLRDPLHRQLLLALRAVADPDDGVAQAALLRPPFFALDLDDLARARAAEPSSTHPGVLRARAARELVADLRRRRLARPPGETARDLVERTALGRAAALGPNGAQRLAALRELCLALEARAAEEGLDYDGATARLRAWAIDPVELDPPRPVAGDAVQVLTIHQAKGLEYPIVVLWDACADVVARDRAAPFAVTRDGSAWSVALDGLAWDEPEGDPVGARERRYLEAERRRLLYVAATRARDLLVLPVAGAPDPRLVTGLLASGAPAELVETLEPYVGGGEEPAWARDGGAPAGAPTAHSAAAAEDAAALAAEVEASWREAAREAATPRFAPSSVTAEAHREQADRPFEAGARPPRESRFGPVFGETVHRAIGLALEDGGLSPAAAVARAARATALAERHAEAAEDVARALEALEREGLRRRPGPDLRLEYPVALACDGRLVAGYVDLLAAGAAGLAVVDFKTDAPPQGALAATHAAYVEQVRSYASALEALGLAPAGTVRAGLLFTAEGGIRWVERG